MTRRWQVAGVVVLAGACTRLNPAYDGGTDDDSTVGSGSTATGSSVGTDSSPTTADSLTTRGTSATEGGEGSTIGTTVSVDDTAAETTAAETGVGTDCMPEAPYGVTIDGLALGPCGGAGFYRVAPMGTANDGVLMGTVCENAGDCSCLGDPRELVFSGPLPSGGPLPAALSSCFILQVQLSDAPSCSVVAYSIIEIGGPVAVGSNVANPLVQQPFGFTLDPLSEPCPDECPGSGLYALSSDLDGGRLDVLPDGLGVMVPVRGDTFEVINVGSGIMPPSGGLQCAEVVRWQAVRL